MKHGWNNDYKKRVTGKLDGWMDGWMDEVMGGVCLYWTPQFTVCL